MKKKAMRTAICLVLVGGVATALVAIAATAGSQSDPIVTLSYLTDTFWQELMGTVDEKITVGDQKVSASMTNEIKKVQSSLLQELGGNQTSAAGGTAATYTEVSLKKGQTVTCQSGCEVVLRSGKATCQGGSMPALIDNTDSKTLGNGGSLVQNHLYLVAEERSIAAAEDVTLLVRGSYAISE